MLRRSPIFAAALPDIVSSGLQEDKHLLLKTLWATAVNVTFFAGRVKRRRGPSLAFSAGGDPIRGISQQQDSSGTRFIWMASGGKIYRWYGPAPQLIDTRSYQVNETLNLLPTQWDFCHFGNWTIINKSSGLARIYKPEIGLATFGDSPPNVTCFMKKANFILAFGHGARQSTVSWSDSDNIEVWTATTTNLAGEVTIDDFNTPIRAAQPLGQSIAVFAEDQVALVNYTGSPFYFGQRVVLDGIGALNKKATASDGKNVLGVGRGGVWWTDGLSFRYVDEGYLHDYLQDNVNWDQAGKIHCCRNDYTGCFEFFFPMLGSHVINEGWSMDPRTGGWSRIPAADAKDERRLFRRPLIGDSLGNIYYSEDDITVATPLTLETKPLLIQAQTPEGLLDIHTDSAIDEIDLLLKTASHVQFAYGTAQEADGPYDWTGWIDCQTAARCYKLDPHPSGVYHKLRFQSTADNWDLDLQGFMLFGTIEGSKRTTL